MRGLLGRLLMGSWLALGGAGCDSANRLFSPADGGTGGSARDTGATDGDADRTPPDRGPVADLGRSTDGPLTAAPDGAADPDAATTGPDAAPRPGKDDGVPDDASGPLPDGPVVLADAGPPPDPDGGLVRPPDGGEPPFPDMAIGQDAGAPPDAFVAVPECARGESRPCAAPTCAGGTQHCGPNGRFGACIGPPEACNGQDDDCDALVDEDFPNVGRDCLSGLGTCQSRGRYICAPGGGVQCSAIPGPPDPEACDGADNDCNGLEDDGLDGGPLTEPCYEGPEGSAGVGACEAGVRICERGEFGPCVGQVQPALEVCNAADDDCDGATDDGPGGAQLVEPCYEGPPGTEDVGECRGGVRTCLDGTPDTCQRQVLPSFEICDGLDNDCNGAVDDIAGGLSCACEAGDSRACYRGPPGTEGVGACRGGVQRCAENLLYGPCVGEVVPANETCNGIDDDCDGTVDDGIVGAGLPCARGVGECVGEGVTFCDSDLGAVICDAEPSGPQRERCDGLDNDCDGERDEGFGLGEPCSDGVGQCTARGVMVCGDADGTVCNARPTEPVAELCDGLDNDCDGEVDDGLRLGEACHAGIGTCQAQGVLRCGGDGAVVCGAVPGQPIPEACDGLDNDCNGLADDGNPGGGQLCDTGLAGACAEGIRICAEGAYACRATGQGAAERCDGLDNDCDGQTDEDDQGDPLARPCYEGPAGTEDVGACRAGVQTCDAGLFGACLGQVLPSREICDLADNDCNGGTDDGLAGACLCAPGAVQPCYTGPAATAGVGICRAGTQTCHADGSAWGACQGEVVPGGETCNGLDDDCDGTDDDAPGVGAECRAGSGGCLREGRLVCNPDRGALECDATGGAQQPEICDGVDNDCDGNVDNVAGLGDACTVGVGNCARGGNQVCDLDSRQLACNVRPGGPADEVCDGQDNDCDGTVDDEVPGLGDICGNGVGACRREGAIVCGGPAGLQCNAVPGRPAPELCNGLDDDCDAVTDDQPTDVGVACTSGIGECARPGQFVCQAGQRLCNAAPGAPAPEVCDQRDNDCDGGADESQVCTVFTSCLDAFDGGGRESAIYRVDLDDPFEEVYCDQTTDGGGWMLVGSTRSQTLNDRRANWYADLRTLAPADHHDGIWWGMRAAGRDTHDVRFGCRNQIRAAGAAFDVDLSFYSVVWYNEWTSHDDKSSCFSENEGAGFDQPAAARRNNLDATFLPPGTAWSGLDDRGRQTNYLEGEDKCDASDDFTVDLRDRGMDSNEVDGTDWGEDDQLKKCGRVNNADGQWFVFAREPARFAAPQANASFLVGAGPPANADGLQASSCVEVCAALNGGDPREFVCSTTPNAIDRRAWLDGFGDAQFCVTPAADTFRAGGPYACGQAGCSYSAQVRDHEACFQRRNYCFRRLPAP